MSWPEAIIWCSIILVAGIVVLAMINGNRR
jgi:hypothetical protein